MSKIDRKEPVLSLPDVLLSLASTKAAAITRQTIKTAIRWDNHQVPRPMRPLNPKKLDNLEVLPEIPDADHKIAPLTCG